MSKTGLKIMSLPELAPSIYCTYAKWLFNLDPTIGNLKSILQLEIRGTNPQVHPPSLFSVLVLLRYGSPPC